MERLDKMLSGTGHWTRKEIKDLVKAGRVTANGARVRDSAEKYESDAEICVDGHPIVLDQLVYLMMNKAAGVVSSTEDPRDHTVLDSLPGRYRVMGLFPAGRLDKDTEGLLLLTNDGPLAHRLLSPRYHVKKRYFARVDGVLTPDDSMAFAAGITLRDGTACLPAKLEILEKPNEGIVTVEEGKYHQVKRMLASRGKPVLYLQRLSIGTLELDQALEKGQWRALSRKELERLQNLTSGP